MKTLLIVWLASCAADATTTHMNLSKGTTHEIVLTPNPWANDALIGTTCLATGLTLSKGSVDHPKLSKGLLIGLIGARIGVVAWNLKQGRGER